MDPITTLIVGVVLGAAVVTWGIHMGWRAANYQSPVPSIVPQKKPEQSPEEPDEKQVLPFAVDPNNV